MIKRINLSQQAYRELVEKIVSGAYPGGTKLTEEGLCREFGISRTPIREALLKLETEGMIEPLPKRGVRVKSLDADEVRELFDCRRELETLALRRAIGHLPADEIAELVADLENLPAKDDDAMAAIVESDGRMHQLLADYCGNRYLQAILHQLIRQSAPYRIYRNRGDCRTAAGERLELIRSIQSGDTERAVKLLTTHIDRGADDLARAANAPNDVQRC